MGRMLLNNWSTMVLDGFGVSVWISGLPVMCCNCSGNPQMHQVTALDIAMDWTLSINSLAEVFTHGATKRLAVWSPSVEEVTPISLYRVGFEDVLLRLEDAKSQNKWKVWILWVIHGNPQRTHVKACLIVFDSIRSSEFCTDLDGSADKTQIEQNGACLERGRLPCCVMTARNDQPIHELFFPRVGDALCGEDPMAPAKHRWWWWSDYSIVPDISGEFRKGFVIIHM